ncbi:MAG: hypothetical protein GF309_02240 [Candidatus Lokiarchaeota archaeon]|nr:hypothetical protein [Candidatus Lokiarchaeota archaeon]
MGLAMEELNLWFSHYAEELKLDLSSSASTESLNTAERAKLEEDLCWIMERAPVPNRLHIIFFPETVRIIMVLYDPEAFVYKLKPQHGILLKAIRKDQNGLKVIMQTSRAW